MCEAVDRIENEADNTNLSAVILVSLGLIRDIVTEPEMCTQINQTLFSDVLEKIVKPTCSSELVDTVQPDMLVYRQLLISAGHLFAVNQTQRFLNKAQFERLQFLYLSIRTEMI